MSIAYIDRLGNLLGALAVAVGDELRPASLDAALVQLGDRKRLNIRDLARCLGLTHSATVRMVDQLEGRGLVAREPAAHDRRAVMLTLTPAGWAARDEVFAARSRVLAGILAPLTEVERQDLERLLDRVLDGLPRDAHHAVVLCRLCELQACPPEACPVEIRYVHYLGT